MIIIEKVLNILREWEGKRYRELGFFPSEDLPSSTPLPSPGFTVWIEYESGAWQCRKCGKVWWLETGTPEENEMNFCPFCGRKIVKIQEMGDGKYDRG